MPEAGDLPLRNTMACQQRRQYQVQDVWSGGPEAPGRAQDGDLVLITQQEETARFHRRQEALDLASSSSQGAADDIIRPCRGAGRSDQDNGWFGAQQMLEGNR